MPLIRWEPAREVNSLQSEMNRLFNTFFGDAPAGEAGNFRRWVPAMDLVENDDDFVLRADLPGMSEDDVSIELEDNVLTVSGERKSEQEERREGYRRVERSSGRFSRTLTLPEGVDPNAIQASFDRGVLEVRIPKPEERKPRRVAISVGGKQGAIEGKETQSAGTGQPDEQAGTEEAEG
ncbi:MAG TPA: Hsp20/alpha crystallin family protein [Solirubrobacteraceae bacterium]|jgi:HSP20 family protein|nr:Hsp20/alpha crystallin family protein [Solirubrobacteraceae bacterium]